MKFNENRFRCSGNMERTQNLSVNPLTLTCDLESRYLGHVLCTPYY